MHRKIAILSNVNMNFVIRALKKEIDVYDAEGYGNELGILLNPRSSYHAYNPQMLFLIVDLMELIGRTLDKEIAIDKIDRWISTLEGAVKEDEIVYISDAYLWDVEAQGAQDTNKNVAPDGIEEGIRKEIEALWQNALEAFVSEHRNTRIFPYRKLVEAVGAEKAFSTKTWQMGKILHSSAMQKAMGEEILHRMDVEYRVAKKVLLLDLDNTLWGGLAGEHDITPITLSEEGEGLCYKNLQKVILKMQKEGVVLGIVSKNNEADAMELIANHPEMVLRPEHFGIRKINWQPKHLNIQEIATELNLGLDSFVFFDDNPVERQLVAEMLPQVVVPDFPTQPEDLADAMTRIYRDYFEKAVVTKEDAEKTKQYAENAKRQELQQTAGSFETYLEALQIVAEAVDPEENVERLTQLINKTNQFNLTTKRFTQSEIQGMLKDPTKKFYLYRVTDKFGDNGIVVVLIVGLQGDVAEIEEFTMSCRVMGRNIEHAIIDWLEEELSVQGVKTLKGCYLPTAKNAPVAELYPMLGFEVCGVVRADAGNKDGTMYCRDITTPTKRVNHVTKK